VAARGISFTCFAVAPISMRNVRSRDIEKWPTARVALSSNDSFGGSIRRTSFWNPSSLSTKRNAKSPGR
jgi:hypothetical protein